MQTLTVNRWVPLLGCIVLCFAVAGLGGWVTADSVHSWYPTIEKPPFNPPDWIFGPVWTTLYLAMAIALWRVSQCLLSLPEKRPLIIGAFMVQLGLNGIWSPLFFGWHQLGWALLDIIFLWIAIGLTTILFWRVDKIASFLLFPYWAWVSFAVVLNAAIYYLN